VSRKLSDIDDDDDIKGGALAADVLAGLEEFLDDEPDLKQVINHERNDYGNE
jgi:hypothetical protein